MADIADEALAPIVVEDSDAFRRVIKHRATRVWCLVVAPVELPLYDRHQHRGPRPDRGQRGDAETRVADASW